MTAKSPGTLALHPEILHREGRPHFVVLPYEEFIALRDRLEDLEDALEVRRAAREEVAERRMPLHELFREYDVSREGR